VCHDSLLLGSRNSSQQIDLGMTCISAPVPMYVRSGQVAARCWGLWEVGQRSHLRTERCINSPSLPKAGGAERWIIQRQKTAGGVL
jgi:hypothetical protein